MKKIYLAFVIMATLSLTSTGQCPSGQVEVSIEVLTDNWGYEAYWQLLPSGNNCGNAPIFTGGNGAVGCFGGGDQNQTPGGYPDNSAIVEGPWCLVEGASYDIYSVDDWGDGGTEFVVNIEGFNIHEFETTSSDESFTFTANSPPAIDGTMKGIKTPIYSSLGDIVIKGKVLNSGTTPITSYILSYSVDGGAEVNEAVVGINIQPFEESEFVHSIPWQPSAAGTYNVIAKISNVNGGGADGNPNNDIVNKNINVIPAIPNIMPSYVEPTNTFTYQMIGDASDQLITPRDLDFHPSGELWVVNQETAADGGSVVTYTNPGEPNQTDLYRKDGNAWHFMSLPSGIAFSDNGNFATSPSVFDANHTGGPNAFTGPTLWSSDPLIFAQPSGGNGSHLDMLHESPYSMGIASETENIFWLFDANSNDIVRYDFVEDHGPGNDYHGDGIVRRYPELSVNWISQNISSHLAFDDEKKWLYIVDGGNQRVIRLDVTTGTPGGVPSYPAPEPLAEYTNVTGVTWETVVSSGLTQPCGIAVQGERMIVSDFSNGDLVFYDISGMPATEMARMNTGGAGIQGIEIGPMGRIWYVNSLNNEVMKIEPDQIIMPPDPVGIEAVESAIISLYPNPASEYIRIQSSLGIPEVVSVYDASGKEILSTTNSAQLMVSNLVSGTYLVQGIVGGQRFEEELLIVK